MPGLSAETYGKTDGPGVSGHDEKLIFSKHESKLIFSEHDGQVLVDVMGN